MASTRTRSSRSRSRSKTQPANIGMDNQQNLMPGVAAGQTGGTQQRASTGSPSRTRTRSRSRTSRRSSAAVTTGGQTQGMGNSLALAAPLARECYQLIRAGITKQQIASFVNGL